MIWNSKDIAITLETSITPTTLLEWVQTMDDDSVMEFLRELLCNVHINRFPALIAWMQKMDK